MDTEKDKIGCGVFLTDPIDVLTERVRLFAINAEKKERYEHSVRVADTAQSLCKKYSLEEKLGKLAGIAHDICKDFGQAVLLSLASRDGHEITALEKAKPSLLHGRAAAVKLREDFGIENKDVLEAVAVHTFGKDGMCDLAKVVYVADKIEPGRPHVTKKYLERFEDMTLDEMTLYVLEENISFLKKKARSVAPESMVLLDSLKLSGG